MSKFKNVMKYLTHLGIGVGITGPIWTIFALIAYGFETAINNRFVKAILKLITMLVGICTAVATTLAFDGITDKYWDDEFGAYDIEDEEE
jgi:hypothetical protein